MKWLKQPLKLLHTADWHLGLVSWKSLGGVDRQDEQKECLERMIDQARLEKVDLICHAGDLFHQYHQPPREAIRLAGEVLMELKKIAPVVWVIGNHDWYAIDALKNILPQDIYIVRDFTPFSIPNRQITIFPLPYLSLARFLGSTSGINIQSEAQEKLRAQLRTWEKYFHPDNWHVLVAHLSVEELAAHYVEANQTREIFIKPADLPSGIDYAAFGHLHGFITYTKSSFPLNYPSSLVLDTFFREDQVAGFLIVELQEGKQPSIRHFPFISCRLITICLQEEIELDRIRKMIEKKVNSPRCYIRFRINKKLANPEFIRELKGMRSDHYQVAVIETIPEDRQGEMTSEKTDVNTDSIPSLFKNFCQTNHLSDEVSELFFRYYQECVDIE